MLLPVEWPIGVYVSLAASIGWGVVTVLSLAGWVVWQLVQ